MSQHWPDAEKVEEDNKFGKKVAEWQVQGSRKTGCFRKTSAARPASGPSTSATGSASPQQLQLDSTSCSPWFCSPSVLRVLEFLSEKLHLAQKPTGPLQTSQGEDRPTACRETWEDMMFGVLVETSQHQGQILTPAAWPSPRD